MQNAIVGMFTGKWERKSESRSVVSDSLRAHGPSPWNSPGQNTGVGSLSLFQGIFLTQRLNPGLPHCRWILYQLSHKVSPEMGKVRSGQNSVTGYDDRWTSTTHGIMCILIRNFITAWRRRCFRGSRGDNQQFAWKGVTEVQFWIIESMPTLSPARKSGGWEAW